MMGMGAKAPYMSLLLTLGLSAECVLPVIMTACTMSAVSGAIQYVKRDLYQRKLALIYSIFGFIGIAFGFVFVTHLNPTALQTIMLPYNRLYRHHYAHTEKAENRKGVIGILYRL